MGLFDKIAVNRARKEKDKKIEEAKKLMSRGESLYDDSYQKAYDILFDIIEASFDTDYEYRLEEMTQMYKKCEAEINKQNKRREKDKKIDKAKELMVQEQYQQAYDILWGILMDFSIDKEYREDEIGQLSRDCKAAMERKRKQRQQEKEEIQSEVPQSEDNLKDLQKIEAILRLDSLAKAGLMDGKPYIWFKNNRLCGSFTDENGVGYIKELAEDDDLYLLAKSYEEELNCLVFHAVDAGRTAYLLTVHRNCEEWQHERLKDKRIVALIFSLDEEDYYYDYVDVSNNNGALEIHEKQNEAQTIQQENDWQDGDYEYPLTAENLKEMDSQAIRCLEELVAVYDADSLLHALWLDGKISCSQNGQITVIDEKHPYYAIVQKMQAYWGCMVYHVVESGNLLYLLNVHNDKDCWNYCWPENGRMQALYCNIDDTDESFYVDVKFAVTDGVISCEMVEEETEEVAEENIETAENTESTLEEVIVEIEGRNGISWYNEGIEFYNNKKYTKALYCMENAARLGIPEAMNNVAAMYNMGLGTRADLEKSFYWREKAAVAGHHTAMFVLSGMYYNGEGVEKDDVKSFYWREKAAEGDDPSHWFGLAHCYDNGIGTEKDAQKAFYWLEKAAQGGVSQAIEHIARRYDTGYGTTVDKAKALYWYEKSAENGDSDAMLECYYRYYNGVGTQRDNFKASMWLDKAAATENPKALCERGKLFIQMGTTQKDINDGYSLLVAAGEKGCVDAMIYLGDDYSKDNPDSQVEKDDEKAFYWYEKAAKTGNVHGIMKTLLSYLNGTGVREDDTKAYDWMMEAVDKGILEVPYLYAKTCFEQAEENGDDTFYAESLYWNKIAADEGYEPAIGKMSALYIVCLENEKEKEEPDPEKLIEYMDGFITTGGFDILKQQDKINLLISVVYRFLKHSENKIHIEDDYIEKVIEYLEMAADLGNVDSMDILAYIYGAQNNTEKEFYWCKKAMENGSIDETFLLACMYYDGKGCQQDYNEAQRLYTIAAEAGDLRSIDNLIIMHSRGEGNQLDNEKLFELAAKSAELGSSYGMGVLGGMYLHGAGVKKDENKAFYYMEKAVQAQNIKACYFLGEFYEFGIGCQRDMDKALEMYKKAAAGGVKKAEEKVALFTKQMN